MDNIILNYDEIDYDNFIFFSHFNPNLAAKFHSKSIVSLQFKHYICINKK